MSDHDIKYKDVVLTSRTFGLRHAQSRGGGYQTDGAEEHHFAWDAMDTRQLGKNDVAKEKELLVEQLRKIAEGLGAMFAPFCEVVVHDLADPAHSILAIYNNQSNREIGNPATELGLARVADPQYPQVIANYANFFPDGRAAKSTSIGIKDSKGRYVAALCLNLDVSMLQGMQALLGRLVSVDENLGIQESLRLNGAKSIRNRIDDFAARRGATARSLRLDDRRTLIQDLKEAGVLEIRRAPEIIATYLGVSRATVYADAK